jgi:hypothetical protein
MMLILTIEDKAAWTNIISRAAAYDFYHTWYYHNLDSPDSSRMYVYEEGTHFIAYPLVKRSIPGTEYVDLTSVYGYTGPISDRPFETQDAEFLTRFRHAFLDTLHKERVVSVFSRLHPFFNQDLLLRDFTGLFPNGKSVAIDIRVPIEVQRAAYHKSYRQQIRILREKGYQVRESKSAEAIQTYAEIYTENMKRVGASDYYLFTPSYFEQLLASKEYESKLMLVYLNDEIVSGGVVICTNKIMQVHLMSTRTEHLNLSPPKLVVDETSILGRSLGYEYINLGGGLNFKEDSLFKWKAGFTKLFMDYNSWRFIANEVVYDDLLAEKGMRADLDIDFFPLYRYQKMDG